MSLVLRCSFPRGRSAPSSLIAADVDGAWAPCCDLFVVYVRDLQGRTVLLRWRVREMHKEEVRSRRKCA
ncbi:hypothetical protein CBR_g53819 [Chara braunii]|uniref:Uncharacterized protein n=1 Tax=Chara braunii TaxID=69332 RepID=A0A388K737_CHABU|nr:hypothetical protein CBR_g53819 [Chara braunii]|eukprot:GBG65847.1 hypothetical protein CBR_g53819 [Chara braunii]